MGDNGVNLDLVTLVVRDYDVATAFFVDGLGFDLIEDTPAQARTDEPSDGWLSGLLPPGRDYCLLVPTTIDRSRLSAIKPEGGSPSFSGLRTSTGPASR